MDNLKNIIEGLLFVSVEPLSVEKIKIVIPTADTKTIRSNLSELSIEYESRIGCFILR